MSDRFAQLGKLRLQELSILFQSKWTEYCISLKYGVHSSKNLCPFINPIHCYFEFVTAHTGNNFYDSFIFWDKTNRFRHVESYEFTSFNSFIRIQ